MVPSSQPIISVHFGLYLIHQIVNIVSEQFVIKDGLVQKKHIKFTVMVQPRPLFVYFSYFPFYKALSIKLLKGTWDR